MNTSTAKSVTAALVYVVIALLLNGVYFVVYPDYSPECGKWCLLFLNVAFVCQFLPMIWSAHYGERFLNGGLKVLANGFLIAEIIMAVLLLYNDASARAAIALQLCLLGLFLIIFLVNARANLSSRESVEQTAASRSEALSQAGLMLREALVQHTDSHARRNLQLARATLAGLDITAIPGSEDLDCRILDKAVEVCTNPSDENIVELNRMLMQRRNMAMYARNH